MPNIDQMIVQAEFDNKDFEKGVAQTLKSLDALKKGLDLDKSADSLANLERIAGKLDLSGIADGVGNIASKFTLLGNIGQTAMRRISDSVVDMGTKLAKTALGINDVQAGMAKYETQTKAVQTITNATGKSVAEVETILQKLMKYTDETSYDFSTMVSTIGKFTASGVDLKVAEEAMEGIANEAAKSGAGIQEANRAMYNFAQALSTGSVKLIDWKSIENANMATKEFKEQLISTAIEMGKLSKQSDKVGTITKGVGKKAKKVTVDFKSFNSTLQDGWLTSEVLLKTLQKYSDTSTKFGLDAFHAAQEALTFTDALNAMKDALSSGWMTSLKYIFGDLDEARILWTDVANAMYDYIAVFTEYRNEQLKAWHDHGGYTAAIEAATNIWETFMNILDGVREVFKDIFPPITGDRLVEITEKVRDATASWKQLFGLDDEIEIEEPIKKTIDYSNKLIEGLKKGAKGDAVKELQEELIKAGYKLDRYHADGVFGPETEKAVKQLQRALGVEQTGIFDAATKEAAKAQKMFARVEETTETVTKHAGETYEVEKKHAKTIDDAEILINNFSKKVKTNETQVSALQRALVRTGYLAEDAFSSGIYGDETEEAVKKLQEALGVKVTGAWDKATREAVMAEGLFKHTEVVVEKVTETVGKTTPAMERLQNIMKAVFTVGKFLGNVILYSGKAVAHFISLFSPLVGVLVNAFDWISGIINKSQESSDGINRFELALERFKTILQPVGDRIKSFADKVNAFINDNKWITSFSQLWFVLGNELRKNPFIDSLVNFVGKIRTFVSPVISFFRDLKKAAVSLFKSYKKSGKSFTEFFSDMKLFTPNNKATKFLWGLIDWFLKIRSLIGAVKGPIVDFIEKIRSFISGVFSKIANWAGNKGIGYLKTIRTSLLNVVNSLKNLRLTERIKNFFGTIRNVLQSLSSQISPFVKNAIKSIAEFFKVQEGETVFDMLKRKWEDFKTSINEIVKSVKNKIEELREKYPVFDDLCEKIDAVKETIKDFLTVFKESVIGFVSADVSGIDDPFEKLKERFKSFQNIVDWFIDVKDKLISAWNDLFGKNSELDETNGNVGENGEKRLSLLERAKAFFEEFKTFDFSKLLGPAIAAVGLYLALSVGKAVSRIGKAFTAFGGAASGISGAISSFVGTDTLGGIVQNIVGTMSKSISQRPKDSIGTFLLKASGSILMIAGAAAALLVVLSSDLIDTEKVNERLGAFELLLATIIGALAGLSTAAPNFDKTGRGLLELAAGVGILVLSIAGMSQIVQTVNPNILDQSIKIISGLLFDLALIEAGIAWVSKGNGIQISGILAMCAGVGVLVLAIGKLTSLLQENGYSDTMTAIDKILEILTRVGEIEAATAFLGKTTGSVGINIKISGVLAMCAGIWILTHAIGNVAKGIKNNDQYLTAVDVITEMIGELGRIEVAIAGVGAIGTSKISGVFSGILGVAIGIGVISLALGKVAEDYEKYESYETAFSLISEMLWTFSITGLAASGAIKILSSIPLGAYASAAVGIGLFGGLLLAIGGLIQTIDWIGGGEFRDYAASGLRTLGEGIGSFVKGITEPFSTGGDPKEKKTLIDALKDVITGFSEIADMITPLADKTSSFTRDKLVGVKNLVSALTAMTGGNIVDSISSFASQIFTDKGSSGSGFVDFMNNMVLLCTPLKQFSEKIAEVKSENIEAAVPSMWALRHVAQAVSGIAWEEMKQSIFSFIAGDKNAKDFVSGLNEMLPDLILFSNAALLVNQAGVESAAASLAAIGTAAEAIPGADGLIQKVFGEHDIANFGSKLGTLGRGLKAFSDTTSGIPEGYNPKGAVEALKQIATVADAIPGTDGVMQKLFGEHDIANFGSKLGTLGRGLTAFSKTTVNIPKDYSVEGPVKALTALSDLENGLKEHGGVLQFFEGDNDLQTFGEQVASLGANLSAFNDSIKDIKTNKMISLGHAIDIIGQGLVHYNDVSSIQSYTTNLSVALQNLANFTDYSPLVDAGETIENNILIGMNAKSPALYNAANQTVSRIGLLVRSYYNAFYNAGSYLMSGLSQGIYNGGKSVIWVARNLANTVTSIISSIWKVRSPSRVGYWMGEMLDAGIANGISDAAANVTGASSDMAKSALEAAKVGLATFSNSIIDDPNMSPVIRPVLDLSEVQAGASGIGGYFGNQVIGIGSTNMANRISNKDATNRQLIEAGSNTNLGMSILALNDRIDQLDATISNMKVVMDNGALVGQIGPGIDRYLGKRQIMSRRGS